MKVELVFLKKERGVFLGYRANPNLNLLFAAYMGRYSKFQTSSFYLAWG